MEGLIVEWVQYIGKIGPHTNRWSCSYPVNKVLRKGKVISYVNGFWSGEYLVVACEDGTIQKVGPNDVSIVK